MDFLLSEMRLDDSDFEDDSRQNVKQSRMEILEKRRLRKLERKKRKQKKKKKGADRTMKLANCLRQRVNHFVAIQVTNSNIREQVQLIQEKIMATPYTIVVKKDTKKSNLEDPVDKVDTRNTDIQTGANFKEAMERIQSLHITLNVISLSSDDEKTKAKEAVETCWEKHKSAILENPIHLDVAGLGHFGHKVIFAKLQNEEHIRRLNSLSDDLRCEFRRLNIFQDSVPFKAHITIAKLSKSKTFFQNKIRFFPQDIWSNFQTHSFGQQPIESIQLLAMARDPMTKYYKILSEVHLNTPSNV